MQYEIKIEVIFTGRKDCAWDNDIVTQMIRNHLEYTLPHLPWIRDNAQEIVIKKVETKPLKKE